MGVEAIEMHQEDGKIQNDTKLVSVEKSRDELFTSGKGNMRIYYMALSHKHWELPNSRI